MSEIDSDFLLVVQFDIRLDNRIGNPFTRHRTKISVHTHIAPEMLAETDVYITAIVTKARRMVMMVFLFIFVNVFTFLLYMRRNCGNMTLRGVNLF